LIDRVLAMGGMQKLYRDIVRELTAGTFSKTKLLERLETLEHTIAGPLERERAATTARGDPDYRSPRPGFHPPKLRDFVDARHASIERQFAGESDGYRYQGDMRLRHHGQLIGRTQTAGLFAAADSDGDGIATKKDLTATFAKWFEAWDCEGRGKLPGRYVARGLRGVIRRRRS